MKKLVYVVVDEGDRRARRVRLTEPGLAKLEVGIRYLHLYEYELTERIGGEANLRNLCATFNMMAKACG
jgi:DNA-binding MarR family transcriptional regulator